MPDDSAGDAVTGQPGGPPIEFAGKPFEVTSPEEARPAPQPRASFRVRRIVVSVLAVAALAGSATLGTAAWRIYQQKDATLSTPDQIAGFRRDTSEQAEATADYLRTALGAAVSLDTIVGAVYQDPADAKRSVLFFGGTDLLWSPQQDLDAVLGVVSGEGVKITGEHEVPPGDLGGLVKCGSTATAEGDIAVCGWADHGSIGVAMFPDRKPDESAALLRQFRETTQTRN